jgi:predicted Zn-ribbon and HTH transcriptional regulator
MQLFRVICEDVNRGVLYTQHVPAVSAQLAEDHARRMGHRVIRATPIVRESWWTWIRNKVSSVRPASHCPICEYSFDGLKIERGSVKCPECGVQFRVLISKRMGGRPD